MPKPNTIPISNLEEDKIGEDSPSIHNILPKAYFIGLSGFL